MAHKKCNGAGPTEKTKTKTKQTKNRVRASGRTLKMQFE